MAVHARGIHGDYLRWHGGRASIFQVMNSQVSLRSHSEGSIISDVVPTLGLRLPKHSQKTRTSSGTHVGSREKTPLLEHPQHIVPGQWVYVTTQITPIYLLHSVLSKGASCLCQHSPEPSLGLTKDKQHSPLTSGQMLMHVSQAHLCPFESKSPA